jgi:predicted RNase H-like HicB family nuclease
MRRTFTAVVERDTDTGFYVGFVPGLPGAHTQAESLDELNANLKEVVEMLLEAASQTSRPNSSARNSLK